MGNPSELKGLKYLELYLVYDLNNTNHDNNYYLFIYLFLLSILWNPSGNGNQIVTVCEQHLNLWDVDRNSSTAEVCCIHLFCLLP